MNSRSAARGFLAFLLSLPALKGQPGWAVTYTSKDVCALSKSTVDINCTFKFPTTSGNIPNNVSPVEYTPLWYTKGEKDEPENLKEDKAYGDRIEYICEGLSCDSSSCNGMCTLRIKELRKEDSENYKFRFITNTVKGKYSGVPGVTLSVTDQVKVSFPSSTDPTGENMECHSMCSPVGGFKYNWFRNGQYEQQGMYYKVNINSQDNYSCAVEGYKQLRSPLVYAPRTPSVTVSPSGEIVKGSSVTLSCSSDANPAANYTWIKEHEDSGGRSGQNYTITNITSELRGNYCCQAHNAIGHHNSTCFFIEITSSSQTTAVAVGTIGVLLATILLLVFLWMRTKRASRTSGQGGRPDPMELLQH
ncbi:unnamed protein product [Boreogadus saida]